jgi:hypothetical protein
MTTIKELLGKVPADVRNSPELLTVLEEIYTAMRLHELDKIPSLMGTCDEFTALSRFAKKL